MTGALVITSDAWRSLTGAGRTAFPRETGGLLLGYYTGDGPRVTDAVVVPDRRATRISYRRDAVAATQLLDERVLADATELVGYLGEWHTHPLPVGPSRTDKRSILRLAVEGGHDVILLVAALGAHGWTGFARAATPAGNVHEVGFRVEGNADDVRRQA